MCGSRCCSFLFWFLFYLPCILSLLFILFFIYKNPYLQKSLYRHSLFMLPRVRFHNIIRNIKSKRAWGKWASNVWKKSIIFLSKFLLFLYLLLLMSYLFTLKPYFNRISHICCSRDQLFMCLFISTYLCICNRWVYVYVHLIINKCSIKETRAVCNNFWQHVVWYK